MIVRETEQHFVMTTQHEHAEFAGKIANHFLDTLYLDMSYRNDVLIAINQHDRGWIRLDDRPIMNDQYSVPFTFGDYPLLPKLVLYRLGLDEVEEMNQYAALLCSLHYTSFKHIQRSQLTDCVNFINNEMIRQNRLRTILDFPEEDLIIRHFKLLQLCDEMSLYVCFNPPGVTKENEHPWYREGFETVIDGRKVIARWSSDEKIEITPFLFHNEFSAKIRSKHVLKELVRQIGINEAYNETVWTEQEVMFGTGDFIKMKKQ